MTALTRRARSFRADIRRLIDEIDRHVQTAPPAEDREYRLQHEAYLERRDQARRFAASLAANGGSAWALRDGDAQRIRESLRLSLDYFRPNA